MLGPSLRNRFKPPVRQAVQPDRLDGPIRTPAELPLQVDEPHGLSISVSFNRTVQKDMPQIEARSLNPRRASLIGVSSDCKQFVEKIL